MTNPDARIGGRGAVPKDRTPRQQKRIPFRNPRQLVLHQPSDAEGERDAPQEYLESEVMEVALYHALGDLPEPQHTHRFC